MMGGENYVGIQLGTVNISIVLRRCAILSGGISSTPAVHLFKVSTYIPASSYVLECVLKPGLCIETSQLAHFGFTLTCVSNTFLGQFISVFHDWEPQIHIWRIVKY